MKKLIIASAVAALGFTAGVQAQDAAKPAQDKACLSCHQVATKVVGPSFKDIAAKYRSDKGAEAKLIKKVREGGVGAWGQIPMPPNPAVREKDAQILVKWVLSQK